MAVTIAELRALFARSGNCCAFPGCREPLVADDNLFVGQLCHIEAASPDGPRYNPNQTLEQRHGYKNLLLLCYPHHRRVDSDPQTHTVEWLTQAKDAHEALFASKLFAVRQEFLESVLTETEEYWRQLSLMQHLSSAVHESPVHVDPSASYTDVIDELRAIHDEFEILIGRAADEDNNAEGGRLPWELTHIHIPNLIRLAAMLTWQLEIHYLTLQLTSSPKDEVASDRLKSAQDKLAQLARVSGYVD